MAADATVALEEARRWWTTSIIDTAPDYIRFRGYPIEQLIGRLSFPAMILLMVKGEVPDPRAAALVEAVMLGMIDHGPHAPTIATARMAATCGVPMNGILGSAMGLAGDIHGGVGQELMGILYRIAGAPDIAAEAATVVAETKAAGGYVPGFGHRWHKDLDPRIPRLFELIDAAAADGVIAGRHLAAARALESAIAAGRKKIPMNVDGAEAVILCELGLDPELGRGIFVLARAAGCMVHAWEEMRGGGRLKGPMAKSILPTYTGPGPRNLA
jgi:citrate synthase